MAMLSLPLTVACVLCFTIGHVFTALSDSVAPPAPPAPALAPPAPPAVAPPAPPAPPAVAPSAPLLTVDDIIIPVAMEPLPEYIAARPESRVVSKYWTELESRRMATLKTCEMRLWDKSQIGAPAPQKGTNVVRKSLSPDVNEVFVPVYEGRAVVQDIETSLKKCLDELRRIENRNNEKTALFDAYLTAIGQEIDQIESCQLVGGDLNFEKTAAAVARIKSQVAKQPDLLEAMDFLTSTIVKLKLDKDTCVASLGLPQRASDELSYPNIPGSPQV
ncbi:translation initiation factor IF-2-like [Biomphalaria glabrata]|uniref:Translation initiation factor IF-2-like n=1 Tax=Biomphalaria glabrata TaxID=6526 RepID=A0A9W2Z145_BIOGL|nr:translation initiation factor IF-2-like [Biomphalaria glabrata]